MNKLLLMYRECRYQEEYQSSRLCWSWFTCRAFSALLVFCLLLACAFAVRVAKVLLQDQHPFPFTASTYYLFTVMLFGGGFKVCRYERRKGKPFG